MGTQHFKVKKEPVSENSLTSLSLYSLSLSLTFSPFYFSPTNACKGKMVFPSVFEFCQGRLLYRVIYYLVVFFSALTHTHTHTHTHTLSLVFSNTVVSFSVHFVASRILRRIRTLTK